ncbi:hypothetical protein DCS_07921 [Drechmeria coniospora]|uniref:proline--tRNA ligase n=1 Tax=Drechmeria coniospora TaxID=98403 RepID=A0A151GFW4_DRECN|nr:hypothetical protein DCS_07921 [Drechmeria coniospora]KYK55956.1 hypothetical protein DCS_07921 [Drechmeria coniospora]
MPPTPRPASWAQLRLSNRMCGRGFSHSAQNCAIRTRSVLSKLWVPAGGLPGAEGESGHDKLIRAGFLRQAHSGVFQLLPLGLRVQQKIEALLDLHMQRIGASRLSLSTISSEKLWRRSGRLDNVSPELFRFADRKKMSLILSPTHEEEITSLLAGTIKSYKDLPLRLYQSTRKYRDEIRPRHGLLRAREFTMKDLYTFDTTVDSAIGTYQEVSAAYRAFFADLKLGILVAEASSGDMGGDCSHEYHLVNPLGEDVVASCGGCGYTANDEVAMARPLPRGAHAASRDVSAANVRVWRGITKCRETLVNAWYTQHANDSQEADINVHAIKEVVPELDLSIGEPLSALMEACKTDAEALSTPIRVINVVDYRLAHSFDALRGQLPVVPTDLDAFPVFQSSMMESSSGQALNIRPLTDGDECPRCEKGTLQLHRALELGHTFYLGTRYSKPLELSVTLPSAPGGASPVQMGCYGIGVSRIFGAVAEHKVDSRGLNWPRAIAPFEVVVIPTSAVTSEAINFFDTLVGQSPTCDLVLDDRRETFGWKMRDAEMIGYPVAVVLGKAWRERGICEVQCRSLAIKDEVAVDQLPTYLPELLSRL